MMNKKIAFCLLTWILGISGLHITYNLNWADILNDRLPLALQKIYVAFIPVT
jgi:hypothetical protein